MFGGVIASAQSGQPRPIKAAIETRNEVRDELKSRLASTSQEIRDLIKNRIAKKFGKMFERFQATIDRETAIMNKINSRVEKIKANGGTTTEAEKLIVDAKIHLSEAQTALNLLKSTATSTAQTATTTSETITKNVLANMKKIGQEIEKHLREAHKDLQKTIGVLRGVSQLRNASTTKEKED